MLTAKEIKTVEKALEAMGMDLTHNRRWYNTTEFFSLTSVQFNFADAHCQWGCMVGEGHFARASRLDNGTIRIRFMRFDRKSKKLFRKRSQWEASGQTRLAGIIDIAA